MALSDTSCRTAKPCERIYRKADGGGLYLEITPSGSKYWRLKYRYAGKEKRLSFGVYPSTSLQEAREAREKAKKLLKAGLDPQAEKKARQRRREREAKNTFEAVAREWHENQIDRWSKEHAEHVIKRLEVDVFPQVGCRPISEIDAPELLDVLRRIEKRGALDIARRAKQICGQVFRYGIATGYCKRDHTADLKDALKSYKSNHFASLEVKELPAFLSSLKVNQGNLTDRTMRAVNLLMLTFVRTTELIEATWDEIDFDNALWLIPAERMKMRKPHIVPLSRQAIALFKAQQEEVKDLKTDWVFPSQIGHKMPMSNNTVLAALRRMGYQGKMTGHGFRSLAMTTIKEKLGYAHDVVDRQLAHGRRNKVAAAYDRSEFLEDRTRMMQHWSDYIDMVASHGKIIPFNRQRAA